VDINSVERAQLLTFLDMIAIQGGDFSRVVPGDVDASSEMRYSAIHTAQVFPVVVIASSDRSHIPQAVDARAAEVILFAEEDLFFDEILQQ
jgi:hypothetical protein